MTPHVLRVHIFTSSSWCADASGEGGGGATSGLQRVHRDVRIVSFASLPCASASSMRGGAGGEEKAGLTDADDPCGSVQMSAAGLCAPLPSTFPWIRSPPMGLPLDWSNFLCGSLRSYRD